MDFETKKNLFLKMSDDISNLTVEDSKFIAGLINSLIDDLIDDDLLEQTLDYYSELFNHPINFLIPDEMIGNPDQSITIEVRDQFVEIYDQIDPDSDLASKMLKKFAKENGKLPGVYFLELMILQSEESRKFPKRLQEYARKFPDNHLINLMLVSRQLIGNVTLSDIKGYPFNYEDFFPERSSIHPIESFQFISFHLFLAAKDNNITKLEAFSEVLKELDLPEKDYEMLGIINSMMKFHLLISQLS